MGVTSWTRLSNFHNQNEKNYCYKAIQATRKKKKKFYQYAILSSRKKGRIIVLTWTCRPLKVENPRDVGGLIKGK